MIALEWWYIIIGTYILPWWWWWWKISFKIWIRGKLLLFLDGVKVIIYFLHCDDSLLICMNILYLYSPNTPNINKIWQDVLKTNSLLCLNLQLCLTRSFKLIITECDNEEGRKCRKQFIYKQAYTHTLPLIYTHNINNCLSFIFKFNNFFSEVVFLCFLIESPVFILVLELFFFTPFVLFLESIVDETIGAIRALINSWLPDVCIFSWWWSSCTSEQ